MLHNFYTKNRNKKVGLGRRDLIINEDFMCWKMQCHSSCSFVIFLLNQDKVIYHQKIYLRENDFSFLKIYEISIACMYALLPM